MPGTQEDTSANGRLCCFTAAALRNRPHHPVGARRGYPPELVASRRRRRASRVVGARLEHRAAAGAADVTDALDEPARRQCRVAEHPQLATPNPSAAQRKQAVAGAQCRAHGVLDNRESAQRPVRSGWFSSTPQRVG